MELMRRFCSPPLRTRPRQNERRSPMTSIGSRPSGPNFSGPPVTNSDSIPKGPPPNTGAVQPGPSQPALQSPNQVEAPQWERAQPPPQRQDTNVQISEHRAKE